MDNPQATDFEIGWFAGIVDGEGWLGMTITRDNRGGNTERLFRVAKTELKITNCDDAIILKSAAIMRKMGVNPYLRTHNALGENRRLVHECSTKHMLTVERILLVIRDHLTGNKRERADVMLRFIELRRNNPGVPNPAYENAGSNPGRRGPGTLRPYSAEELNLVATCRELQSRGASETTRESREQAVRALRREHASWPKATPAKI